MLPTDLKARVLAAAHEQPAPTRRQVARKEVLLLMGALVTQLALFFSFGGVHPGARAQPCMLGTAIGAALLAGGAAWITLLRGRSMLGRPRGWLVAVVVVLPVLLFGWKLWWSAHFVGATGPVPGRVGLRCFALSLTLAAAPLVAFLWARRHSDPTHPRALGAAAGVAVGASAWTLVDCWCPIGHPGHLLMGHVLPLVLLAFVGMWLGGSIVAVRGTRR
jgi:hypothetical protein